MSSCSQPKVERHDVARVRSESDARTSLLLFSGYGSRSSQNAFGGPTTRTQAADALPSQPQAIQTSDVLQVRSKRHNTREEAEKRRDATRVTSLCRHTLSYSSPFLDPARRLDDPTPTILPLLRTISSRNRGCSTASISHPHSRYISSRFRTATHTSYWPFHLRRSASPPLRGSSPPDSGTGHGRDRCRRQSISDEVLNGLDDQPKDISGRFCWDVEVILDLVGVVEWLPRGHKLCVGGISAGSVGHVQRNGSLLVSVSRIITLPRTVSLQSSVERLEREHCFVF